MKEDSLIFDNGFARLYQADARRLPIKDESVDCVVTSPPYWGLRDYGLEEQGIGLEPTPEAFCANMVEVFREVWRVLKPTGTVWMNLGDSYSGGGGAHKPEHANPGLSKSAERNGVPASERVVMSGLKPKDLVGIPWRVAFALQADGWYLRSDIIWSKPNPMPESVTDRPTKAHEYIFLLTKSPKYYYDADAIREHTGNEVSWDEWSESTGRHAPSGNIVEGVNAGFGSKQESFTHPNGRNKRTVWEIATHPYPEAHFATFPEDLVEPCILAGSSEKGVCAQCGKPWERMVELPEDYAALLDSGKAWRTNEGKPDAYTNRQPKKHPQNVPPKHNTIGWQPTCTCNADVVPATVLDPFAGSGTTLAVAQKFGRKSVGVDLSRDYLRLASNRLRCIPFPMLI